MRLGRAHALAAAVLVLFGCDLPTDGPILEQRWVVPVEESSIAVDELLPAGVAVSGAAFEVAVGPVATMRSLGSLCPQCGPLHGRTVPVPPFQGSFTSTTGLPGDVLSATLASGSIVLAVINGLSFDPLAGGGRVTVAFTDHTQGRLLGELVLDGGQGDALPPGTTVTRTIALAPGTVGATLTATTTVQVPGGQQARLDTTDEIRVTATPTDIRVASARVDVEGRVVDLETVEIDVEDIDLDDQIEGGELILEVANPFGVGFTGQIHLSYPNGVITKAVTIAPGAATTTAIAFDAGELHAILGSAPVTLTGSGTVSGGAITVSPQQSVAIEAKIRLTLRIGD